MKNIYWVFGLLLNCLMSAGYAQDKHHESAYRSDVIGVNEAQLRAQHWLAKLPPSAAVLMQHDQIERFNQQLVVQNPYVVNPMKTKTQLSRNELITEIDKISAIPASPRFYANGEPLTAESYQGYLANLNKHQLGDSNQIRWGVVVTRAPLRTFPTSDRVFNAGMDTDLDRFQESGVFPGSIAAILHESADKLWYLVQTYNYLAWIPQSAIAIADKADIESFASAQQSLLVTGSKVYTSYMPDNPAISQVQLDMGVRLPLVNAKDAPTYLGGQNSYASYVVKLPTRTALGDLKIELALVARSQDVNTEYLPFTQQNIVKQAFKFLGERYGWGHDYNGRDCTGFVSEVYKSFGFIMPRNSGQQGQGDYGVNTRFSEKSSREEKLAAIKKLAVGDLIYIPGHVMMYLGDESGEPYVIHDVKGLAYIDEKGELYRGSLNGVSITPLLPLHLSKTTTYLDKIYNIKRIQLKED